MKNGLLFFFCLTFFACQKNEVFYPSSVDNYSSFEDFERNDKAKHYLIIETNISNIELQEVREHLKIFHEKYFKNKDFRASNIFLGFEQTDRTLIFVLRNFSNKKEVMDYYSVLKKKGKKFFPKYLKYELLPITQRNYRVVLKNRSLKGYAEFFEANY